MIPNPVQRRAKRARETRPDWIGRIMYGLALAITLGVIVYASLTSGGYL